MFVGWFGDDCSGVGECTITLNTDKILTAGLVANGNNVTKKNRNMEMRSEADRAYPQSEPNRRAERFSMGLRPERSLPFPRFM